MRLNEFLGIKYPIIQGGMANIALGEFAAAVSNAGGLGLIASGGFDAERIREEIKKCRALTDKPFGVNLMLMNPDVDNIAKMLVEEKVDVITTGAGSPEKYVADWKAVGTKVIPVVSGVALAKRMERMGVDALIAEGGESGGHVGEMTTMTRLLQPVVSQMAEAWLQHLRLVQSVYRSEPCCLPVKSVQFISTTRKQSSKQKITEQQ